MPQPGLRLSTVTALVFGLLAVGLAADNLAWLAGLRTVIQRSPSRFPSSLAVPPAELTRPGALLSVYTEAQYLYAPDHGLLTNPTRVGRDWEHPATVSYFEDGDLRFAANAGLRVHGGTSRTGSPVPSFRLYFRTEYGSAQFRGGTLFAGKGDPLTRLVVHNDLRQDFRGRWWHLVNPLAYDVARRIGALAPETHPASFILNGDPQGLYVLTEHVRKPFLVSRFGHDNFDRADEALRRQWMRDVMSRPSFTMADAATWLDIESLTRWFISIVFCGTSDPFQAVMFRNRTQPGARWFWVNWDMDHSFMDLYRRALAPWSQDSFERDDSAGCFRGTGHQAVDQRRPRVSRVPRDGVPGCAQLSDHACVPERTVAVLPGGRRAVRTGERRLPGDPLGIPRVASDVRSRHARSAPEPEPIAARTTRRAARNAFPDQRPSGVSGILGLVYPGNGGRGGACTGIGPFPALERRQPARSLPGDPTACWGRHGDQGRVPFCGLIRSATVATGQMLSRRFTTACPSGVPVGPRWTCCVVRRVRRRPAARDDQ